jgi:NAD(P)-dependent dehydrogenase (short-subunit alcohol dehydrogenase family)
MVEAFFDARKCYLRLLPIAERQLKNWLTPKADRERKRAQCLPARVFPGDVADMVLFLGSDASSRCTAQDFMVDARWK